MAVATGTLRKQQRVEAKAAAKAKRDKIILIGGSVLLVAVLAFELPKVLGGSSSSAPTPAPTVASTPAATAGAPAVAGVPTPALVARELKTISHLNQKNPFTPQLSVGAVPTTNTPPFGKAPAVRGSHFKLKDPFKAQLAVAAPAVTTAPLAQPTQTVKPVPVSKPKVVASPAPYGYIVILRSLDTKAAGLSEVKRAHAAGLTSAGLLFSSKYTTLRHGYWVVYLAKYRTWDAANAGLQAARAHGYASAYRRPARK